MCGIAGIVKKDGGQVLKSEIKNLTDIISHRGPDDEGFYIHNNFALGHRRLSILDLSIAGHQPLNYQNIKVIFNGEIYNYIEIRKELEKANFKFKTGTDTEVIAAAYLYWGEDCVNQFNGMWAFVIYDETKNIFFCSRDRFGIKPFYYVNNSSFFAFGSEIKQLHSLGFNKVNLQILFDYLYIGYQNHTAETFFKDVFQLEPAHNLIYEIENQNILIKKYYHLELKTEINHLNLDQSELFYENTIKRSISLRLRSDVKVGTCLSGGLDSSYIASVAANFYHEKSNRQFTSITARSGDDKNDETNFAKLVVQKAVLDGKYITPSSQNILEDFQKIVYHQEEPFGSPSIFMQFYVMKAAKENGCTVLLDGQGGDETLLGYERYYISFLKNVSLKNFPFWLKIIRKNSKLSMKDIISYYFYFNFPFVRVIHLRKRISGIRNEFKKYFNQDLVYEYSNSTGNLFKLQKLEITKTQLRSLLNYEDKNSMAWSIETRLPFLDYSVVEAAVSIKPEFKINEGWSKFLLRKIGSKVLPEAIAWRKNKIGFEAPQKFWDMNPVFDSLIYNSKILNTLFIDVRKIGHPALRWKLLSIAMWEKQFGMELLND
jgi:asparagine synthase (glutamine-hydrolysing)